MKLLVQTLIELYQEMEQDTANLRKQVTHFFSKTNASIQYSKYLRKQTHTLLERYYSPQLIPTVKTIVTSLFDQIELQSTQTKEMQSAAQKILLELL